MRRDPASGVLLVLGALGLLMVAGLHPTGHDLTTAQDVARVVRLNAIVHGAAIGAIAILFAGTLGLSRSIGGGAWSTIALSFFALAGIAAMSAAVMSGFVAPAVLERLRDGSGSPVLEILGWFSWRVNQGFAGIHIAGSAVAILLWSVTLVRARGAVRACGIFGSLVGLAVLIPLVGGHLRLDVHGFGAVMLAQSAWLVWIGILLLRGDDATPPVAFRGEAA